MSYTPTAVRALSFGRVADAYDRYRPGPPGEAVAWVLPAGATDVLDLGAGTGAVTRLLIEQVLGPEDTTARDERVEGPAAAPVRGKVVSAEPDERMRAVLVRRSPRALPVGARAEALPFADRSFDAVVVSSAWHWMDPALTVSEVGRILRPGGRLGVLWNGPVRDVPWVADLLGRGRRPTRPAGEARPRHVVELPGGAPFASPETTVMAWSKPTTSEELVGLTGTCSRVITRSAEERAELLARIERVVASDPGLAGGASIDLPMRCLCWRATRV